MADKESPDSELADGLVVVTTKNEPKGVRFSEWNEEFDGIDLDTSDDEDEDEDDVFVEKPVSVSSDEGNVKLRAGEAASWKRSSKKKFHVQKRLTADVKDSNFDLGASRYSFENLLRSLVRFARRTFFFLLS